MGKVSETEGTPHRGVTKSSVGVQAHHPDQKNTGTPHWVSVDRVCRLATALGAYGPMQVWESLIRFSESSHRSVNLLGVPATVLSSS